jgi:peptidoglycan-N-acetylglucosamine deacetylase
MPMPPSVDPTLSAVLPHAPAVGAWPRPRFINASVGLHLGCAAATGAWPEVWHWALGAVALNHLALTGAGLWPRSRLLGPNVLRLPAGPQAASAICLTLDDGPDPEVTPQVLDLLDTHSAKASFFCIAHQAQQHAALTREIVRRGHCVQNHSAHHRHNFSLLGPAGLAQEVNTAQQILADLTGHLPHCFRAPAGLRNPLLDPVLHRLNLHLVSWTRRGFDTRDANAARVQQRLSTGLAAGDILLLHDGHARRTAGGQPVLLQVLPALLALLAQRGLGTTTLSAALAPRHVEVSA